MISPLERATLRRRQRRRLAAAFRAGHLPSAVSRSGRAVQPDGGALLRKRCPEPGSSSAGILTTN